MLLKLTATIILAACCLSSCASTPQTQSLLDDPGSLSPSHQIHIVPYVQQSENYCGPAALTMITQHAGIQRNVEELGAMLYTPGKKGTLQSDLIGATRRLGLLATPVKPLRSVLEEIQADHPVLVMQNLGSSANPLWHYAVVIGYDLKARELTLHSGPYPHLKLDLSQFERTWRDTGDWALVAVKPPTLPATASAPELLKSAAALERVSKTHEAQAAYAAILKKWPDDVAALFGLGNTHAALGEWRESAQALEKAASLQPESVAILNNLREVRKKIHRSKIQN